jgi:hypothetical protein
MVCLHSPRLKPSEVECVNDWPKMASRARSTPRITPYHPVSPAQPHPCYRHQQQEVGSIGVSDDGLGHQRWGLDTRRTSALRCSYARSSDPPSALSFPRSMAWRRPSATGRWVLSKYSAIRLAARLALLFDRPHHGVVPPWQLWASRGTAERLRSKGERIVDPLCRRSSVTSATRQGITRETAGRGT